MLKLLSILIISHAIMIEKVVATSQQLGSTLNQQGEVKFQQELAFARPVFAKNEQKDLYEHIVSSMNVQNIFEEQNPIQCMLCKLGISTISFPFKITLVQDLI